jgi:hypothetical protein
MVKSLPAGSKWRRPLASDAFAASSRADAAGPARGLASAFAGSGFFLAGGFEKKAIQVSGIGFAAGASTTLRERTAGDRRFRWRTGNYVLVIAFPQAGMLVPPAARHSGLQAAHRGKAAALCRGFVWPIRMAVARMILGMTSMPQNEEDDDEEPA